MRSVRLAVLASLLAGPLVAQPPACSSISVIQLPGYNCEAAGLLFYFPATGWPVRQTVSWADGNGSFTNPLSYDLVWTTIGNRVTLAYVPIGAQTLTVTATATPGLQNNSAGIWEGMGYQVYGSLASVKGIWGTHTETIGTQPFAGAMTSGGLGIFRLATWGSLGGMVGTSGVTAWSDGSTSHSNNPWPTAPLPINQTTTFQTAPFVVLTSIEARASTSDGYASASISAQWATEFVSNATTVTPEPATWALMLTGLVGIGFVGLRNRRKIRETLRESSYPYE